MSENNIIGSELSCEVKSLSGLAMLIDYAACFDQLMACIPCGRPLTIQERRKLLFAATDRLSLQDEDSSSSGASHRNSTYDYDMPRDVLELVLSQNHCIGDSISKEAGVIVEMPDQIQFIPGRPPLPKGSFQMMQDSVQNLVNLLSLNPTQIPERQKDRWDPAEQRAFELILSHNGRVRSERMSHQVSLFVRHATPEEVAPYNVDFHISQKAWYERVVILMTESANAYHERTASGMQEYQKNDRVRTEAANVISEPKMKKPIPGEIALKGKRAEKKKKNSSRAAPENENVVTLAESTPQKNVWIPDFDVVLGVQKSITTVATAIFEDRVLPVYSSKTQLRESHIKIMKLMLQEELRDEANIVDDDIDMPESKFWVKMSEMAEDPQSTECKTSDNTESKWLRLGNGDFVGPFVVANTASLQHAVDEWRSKNAELNSGEGQRDPEPSFSMAETAPPVDEQPSLDGKQRDPEPSFSALEAAPTDEEQEDPPVEDIRPALSKGCVVTALSAAASDPRPLLFNMDGPLNTLGEEARKLCQKWVDDSETLLIKAAKKKMIDTFQSDFHSFLFLFQVQMKRIKGGDLSSKSGGSNDGIADDCSWVSAEPSVAEEDTRVEDIEMACTAFMNRMGNNMVMQYEKLAGVDSAVPSELKEETCEAPLVSLFSDDTHDDQVLGAPSTEVRGAPSAEAPEIAKTMNSLKSVKSNVCSEERQSNSTSIDQPVEERQPESKKERHYLYQEGHSVVNNHTFMAKQENPEKSAVENVKSVSFDLHESGNKLKAAIMQLENQRRRETPKKRPVARKYQRNDYNIDFSDEEEFESSTKSSTRTYPASDNSPSFDTFDTFDTFEPSLEASFDSTNDSKSYERTVSYRSRSRTFSTEYADSEYIDDDDTFPTFDSRRDDDYEDDDTFPTFDSRRNDSMTLSPSERSFEDFFKKNEEEKSSWLPAWFA